MKLALSYFYQIRNFKKFMIPVSTAVWDPKWFHDFKNKDYIFKDKNGIYNGIRFEELMPNKNCDNFCLECKEGNNLYTPQTCEFLKRYRNQIQKLDKDELFKKCN